MNIRDIFSQLLDLPITIALQEAKAKLNGTVMRVNGNLKNILDMDNNNLVTRGLEDEEEFYTGESIETLEFFLPETGIYFVEDSPVFLYKNPKRQWKKSFSWGFYDASKSLNILLLDESKRFEVYEHNKFIYYMDKVIGKRTVKKPEYTCINSVFKVEFDRFVSSLNG